MSVFSARVISVKGCSELLTATALRKGSLDNTSAMVVDLRGLWAAETSGTAAVGPSTITSISRAVQELRASSPYSSSKAPEVAAGGRSNGGSGGGDSDIENPIARVSASSRPPPASSGSAPVGC